MSDPQNLVVNMKSGRVHRKYTEERGWVPCRACHPFKEEA